MDEYDEIETTVVILPGVDLTLWTAIAVLLVAALAVASIGISLP
jgi:hypothetical protein